MENTSHSIIINVTEEGIEINNQLFSFPLNFSYLKDQFGSENLGQDESESNFIYLWHDLGIKIFKPKDEESGLVFVVKTAAVDESYLPKNKFSGALTFNHQNYIDFFAISEADKSFKDKELKNVRISCWLSLDGLNTIEEVSIWKKDDKKKKRKIVQTDKFKPNKITGKAIVFADFNFKLAIIEELMYTKKLITPKFDIFEFVDAYEPREIDVEEEGYAPIPEALDYFKNLEIDESLAEHVTQIYQDGGNDIYMNITPYWDGEDDSFNIQNYADIQHFPNLKKMTLFSNDPKVYEALKAKGIDAKSL